MRHTRQSGSALFVILIAVALFAALSYAFTQGSRTSQSQLTDQQAKMGAQELLSYGNTLADTVQKLRLRGCKETALDFSNTVWQGVTDVPIYPVGHNPNAPSSGCSVFSTTDGMMQALTFERYADLSINIPSGTKWGHGTIYKARIEKIGDPAKEDVYLQVPPILKQVCLAINNLAGVPNPNGNPPDGDSALTSYDGTFNETLILNSADGSFAGKTQFCYTSGSRYRFVSVILAR